MALAIMNSKLLFSVTLPTDDEMQLFFDRCDPLLLEEIAEEMMIEFYLTFSEFYDRYQAKHLLKYGQKLSLKIELPITLKN